MDRNDPAFQEFVAFWRLSEELVANASKGDLAETARILAMQVAHMTRKFGEQPLPEVAVLTNTATLNDAGVAVLRDGAEVFVGVLASVSGQMEDDAPPLVQ